MAILCNHQRGVSKAHDGQMTKLLEKKKALEEEYKEKKTNALQCAPPPRPPPKRRHRHCCRWSLLLRHMCGRLALGAVTVVRMSLHRATS